jgi:hypothetical protein
MKNIKRENRNQTLSRRLVIVEEDKVLTKRHSNLRAFSDEKFFAWIGNFKDNGSRPTLIMASDGGAYSV